MFENTTPEATSTFAAGLAAITDTPATAKEVSAYTSEQIHAGLTDLHRASVERVITSPWGTTPNQSAALAAQCAQMPRSDMGFGQRIAAHYEGHLVFMLDADNKGTWWSYNGLHWTEDTVDFLSGNAARAVAAGIIATEGEAIMQADEDYAQASRDLAAAEAQDSPNERLILGLRKNMNAIGDALVKEHKAWANTLQDGPTHLKSGIAAAAWLLSETGGFDTDDHKINTPAGYLDLRTRECVPHDPKHLVSKITVGSYVPGLTHPDIDAVIAGMENQGEGYALYFQRFMGMAITGVNAKAFFYLDGAKDTAKSTGLVSGILGAGSYAATPSAKALIYSAPGESASPTMHGLRGVRMAFSDEAEKAGRIQGSNFLILTSGGVMNTRQLHGKPCSWRSKVTVFMAGNGRIGLDGGDEGISVRLYGASFTKSLTEDDMDTDLTLRIERNETGQLDAMFTWMADGAHDWLAEGSTRAALKMPAAAAAYTKSYLEDSDPFKNFLDRHVRVVPEGEGHLPMRMSAWNDLYVRFYKDTDVHESQRLSGPEFKAAMHKMGYIENKAPTTAHHAGWTTNKRFIPGITLADMDTDQIAYKYPELFTRTKAGAFMEPAKPFIAPAAEAPVVEAAPTAPTLTVVPDWDPMGGASTDYDEDEGYCEYEA